MVKMSETTEKIGNVVLNYEYYDGEDYYSEGEAEDALLDLVTRFSEKDYEHIIQNSRSWNIMYHLSHVRENIVSWIPISRESRVLEIGAGCGAITGILSSMAKKVTCIELSKKRSLINATRHKEYGNIEILVGNFETIEPNLTEKFDVITLIGVLEYGASYIHSDDPYNDILRKVEKHLAPGGKIIIAIENKFGLKYFAGCKEDHTGRYFEGIEGYTNCSGVKTFSREGLEEMFASHGMQAKFFYPYPDYKLPNVIYSDEHLPKQGELNTNLRNFDNDRVVLFDECKAFDTIIDERKFPFFANSFLAIVTKENPYDAMELMPVFAKYASERLHELRTATIIYEDREKNNSVYKVALNHDANVHVKQIFKHYEELSRDYAGTRFIPNKCEYIEGKEPAPLVMGAVSKSIDSLKLDFVDGMNLEEYLYDLAKQGEYDEVTSIIKKYISIVCSLSQGAIFRETERFNKIFKKRKFSEVYNGKAGSNYDIIFSNIVFDKDKGPDGNWNILDYEWVFDFPIPDKFLAFRGVYYFLETKENGYKEYYDKIGVNIYEELGFSDQEVKMFTDMEHCFQVYIIGGVASLEVLHAMMPTNTVFLNNILKESEHLRNLNNPKIYYSHGEGFSDDKRIYVMPELKGPRVTMEIPLKNNMRAVRIDPTEYASIVTVIDFDIVNNDDSVTEVNKYLMNGYAISGRTFIFDTDDAQIVVEGLTGQEKSLRISYEVSMFLQEMYDDVLMNAKAKQSFEYREPSYKDKVLMKLHLKKRPDPLPEGYHYNVL